MTSPFQRPLAATIAVALCAVLPLAAAPAAAAGCRLDSLVIAPLDGPHGERWRGTRAGIEVLFHNDVQDHPVTLFPEPPVTVRRAGAAGECRIDEGGVWARDGVWLSADGRTLVTAESSGSALDLVFHDTATCARLDAVGIAGASWHVRDGRLALRRPEGRTSIELDASCRPAGPRRAP